MMMMIRIRQTTLVLLLSLAAAASATAAFDQEETSSRELLQVLNRRDLARHGSDDLVVARMRSYELAARMQVAVPEAANLALETAATREAYGMDQPETDDFGRSCLLARRLLEKGVRFVQLFSGGSFGSPRINWDGHEDMRRNHTRSR